ncbi:nuclear pore glycoprotein p62 [Contarinia nasturtii]|uniref:nuclear pore glycoprotein p62 n=1 Tax=Contarinia nasturtii TaxID=265458 RepID=UPI0012D395A3|nr:nuclear pore glycoprotein p62 [Contarinia nasturtii]
MNPSGGGFGAFSFGTPTFGAGNISSTAPATTNTMSFGTPAASIPVASATATASVALSTAPSAFGSFGTFGAASTASNTLPFGTMPATTSSNLSFGTPATTTSAPAFGTTNTLPFGAQAAKPAALPTFGASIQQQTNAPTATLSTAAAAAAASTVNTNLAGPAIGYGSSTTTTQSTAVVGNQMTFSQIEEMINKYTSELEEQEKVFINQATQVNSWDNLLNKNSKKIVELSNAVEKVKSEQKCLEDELKFIETQHTELEEFIAPLKKDVDKIPHSDLEKAQTYSLAENLDTQLRQMSEDLKEVIEHLNEVSKLQNSNDPIVQIGRILNAHMTSLQWIELSTSNINVKLEEINKMYDTLRRDTERSLRLTYCD